MSRAGFVVLLLGASVAGSAWAPAAAAADFSLDIAPVEGPPASTVDVSGDNCSPGTGDAVVVTFTPPDPDPEFDPETSEIAGVFELTPPTNSYSGSIVVPAVEPGAYQVNAFCVGEGGQAVVPPAFVAFTVTDANRDFVTRVYDNFLTRAPDTPGFDFWTHFVDTGGNRSAVPISFVDSAEFDLLWIDSLYNLYLARPPDGGGASYYLDLMQDGATTEDVEVDLLGSDEFFGRAGGTNDGFVTELYETLIGPVDPAGQAYWESRLAAGETRAAVAAQFLAADQVVGGRLTNAFDALLGREPDSDGRDFFTPFLRTYGLELTRAAIASSDEYFAHAHTP